MNKHTLQQTALRPTPGGSTSAYKEPGSVYGKAGSNVAFTNMSPYAFQHSSAAQLPGSAAQLPGSAAQLPYQRELLLGRFSILETRATGGFGYVDICWDTRLQRRVAIKCIPLMSAEHELYGAPAAGVAGGVVDIPAGAPAGTFMGTSVADAMAEARIACMLAHPNIVTVLDFESDESFAYIVMEYVDGLSLEELLARVEGGKLTYDEAAYILRSVVQALSFAHDNGVLHLDIKPSNILIDRTGTVKLSDFGMATLASAAGWGGARGGTVGYMPREQILGEMVDERCDVFALATVTWQSITGTCPFDAASAEASLRKVSKAPTPRLSRIDPALAGEAEEIMLAALSPEATTRTADVASFASSFIDVLGDEELGRDSIRHLLGQLSDDEEVPPEPQQLPHVPLAVRAPWMESACYRFASALVCGMCAYRLLGPVTSLLIGGGRPMACGLCLLVAALVPPAGTLLVGGGFAASILLVSQDSTTAVQRTAIALLLFVGMLGWWMILGRKRWLSSAALLSSVAGNNAAGTCVLSAMTYDPAGAFITGALAACLGRVCLMSARVGYDYALFVESVLPCLTSPTFWLWIGGSGTLAALSSWFARREAVWLALCGEFCTLGILIWFEVTLAMVENGGIWSMPNPADVAVALLWFVVVSFVRITFGLPSKETVVE